MTIRTILDDKLDRAFDMLDSDHDGRLREKDLVSLAAQLGAAFDSDAPATVAQLEARFTELWDKDLQPMDTDRDGGIDREEWHTGVRRSAATDRSNFLGRLDAVVQSWMELCDSDGDGRITRSEFITMHERTFGFPADQLDVAFTALDVDGDGTLSREEISTAVEQYYTSEEPDAPGNLLYGPLR